MNLFLEYILHQHQAIYNTVSFMFFYVSYPPPHHFSGGQCHLIHLTSPRSYTWPSLAYNVHKGSLKPHSIQFKTFVRNWFVLCMSCIILFFTPRWRFPAMFRAVKCDTALSYDSLTQFIDLSQKSFFRFVKM